MVKIISITQQGKERADNHGDEATYTAYKNDDGNVTTQLGFIIG